jgi:hypothetical protein
MRFLSRAPLHPVLLAAYAVLFVYAANVSEVLPADLWPPLLVAVAGGLLALGVCALLYRDPRRGALLASALVLAIAFFGHLGAQLDEAVVGEIAQLVAWTVFLVAVAIVAFRIRGTLGTVTAVLNVFTLVLVGLSLLTILPAEASRAVRASAGAPGSAAAANVGGDTGSLGALATRTPDRDIYFLVFDRYGSEWSLEHSFGVESELTDALAARGFQVVPGARSNYHASDFSLATTLNLRLATDVVGPFDEPSIDRTPVRRVLADHDVGRFLRANGYRYYHLGAWWEPTRSSPIADEVLALGETTEFVSVLHEASILPALERTFGLDEADTHSRDQHREQALFGFRQLQRLAGTPERKFVFAHILMPHPPYVLAEGGRVVYNEEAKAKGEAELLQQQLAFTDDMILETVDALLAGPDEEDPIVIITGDEGPYLCYEVDCVDGSAEQYGIRFGVLRAYYLPDLDIELPADDSGVNIFRMVLREYFGADLPDLPNRSYTWVDKKSDLYTMQDVTEVLPLPGGGEAG